MCYHNVLVISTYAGMLHAGRQLPHYVIVLCQSQNIRSLFLRYPFVIPSWSLRYPFVSPWLSLRSLSLRYPFVICSLSLHYPFVIPSTEPTTQQHTHNTKQGNHKTTQQSTDDNNSSSSRTQLQVNQISVSALPSHVSWRFDVDNLFGICANRYAMTCAIWNHDCWTWSHLDWS